MVFEWHTAKAGANFKKHGVSFEQAATVFRDPLASTFPDPDHSGEEGREITVGYTAWQQVVFVAHCWRGDQLRIISARKATEGERRKYEEGIGKERD